MKNKILEEKIIEEIYFALTHWDMNPVTKGFARELGKELMEIINQALKEEKITQPKKRGGE